MKNISCLILCAAIELSIAAYAGAVSTNSYIIHEETAGSFALTISDDSAAIVVSADDFPGVQRAAKDLQVDIGRVTETQPQLHKELPKEAKKVVVIGTIGKNPFVDELVRTRKLSVAGVAGRWETSVTEIVNNPWPGIDEALVIAGSDKRGTIFGIYELSAQIGVSPWVWWADVPPRKHKSLYVLPGRHVLGEPAVKYRGIFLNDEAPALAGWAHEKFGGCNSKFYVHVYELILRLKGNYLWPAMWGRSIYDDDPLSPKLADEYGIVIGTSHHEPMMRAHVEWQRYGSGPWNYKQNPEKLREFWREGIERMGDNESVVTLAMRGDGDEPMSAEADIALLEKIVADQRQILAEVTGKPLESQPQVWALYKEVQEYYDKGMRVPDDVTLLLCDDNWGNLRKLPNLKDKPRAGGYGIYYHFDYVGGPRNYKWLNTTQVSRVWEQMHLAYRSGVDRLWIVNVGDLKPMEYPIEFFLDYAWNPEVWPAERLPEYAQAWAAEQFGPEYAATIAKLVTGYTTINSRRKPELLSPETYSLVNYREWERVVAEYNQLATRAEQIYGSILDEQRDAFYQLVLFPIQACANLNELYYTVARNHLYAKQGRAFTNELAEQARRLYERDAELCRYYNEELANGKWSHMMDQTHIGYIYWQQPEEQIMPEVDEIELPTEPQMGVAVEGFVEAWPSGEGSPRLPELSPWSEQTVYLEIFNRGRGKFQYKLNAREPWVKIDQREGHVETEKRILVSADWNLVPVGEHRVELTVTGSVGEPVIVELPVQKSQESNMVAGFVESNGYVAMESVNYSRAVGSGLTRWNRIPDLGRTSSAMAAFPVTSEQQTPDGDSPHLEFKTHLFTTGKVKVKAYLSPTLDFQNQGGLECAVSFDDQPPQRVNLHPDMSVPAWEAMVAGNINVVTTEHEIVEPGSHTLKFWVVDAGVVLERVVVETGKVPASYLGPPESTYVP